MSVSVFRHSCALVLASLLALPVTVHAATCTMAPDLTPRETDWQGWGNGPRNLRHAPDGLSSADLATLAPRWVHVFAGTSSVVGNPVVQGTVVFIGVDSGMVHALDVDTGCEYWQFQAPAGVRTAPALGMVQGEWRVFFGDRGAQVYALAAASGQPRWQMEIDPHPAAILTGSPAFVPAQGGDAPARLLVPVSSSEEGIAAVPTYVCCSFRGSLASLDAATGKLVWQTHTITGTPASTGEKTMGPSGGAIWSAPTVDLANRRVYVTTGDAYSAPVSIGTDAVMALDLDTGRVLWINQGTADDIWTVACMRPGAPEECGPDQDYGSPAMLVELEGTPVLVAGQKSGMVRGFTPLGGTILWERALVENTTEFGGKIIWGGTADADRAYFGLGNGGIAAVDLASSRIAWFSPLPPADPASPHVGHDGPLTRSGDLVWSGGWDGVLRALDAGTGEVLWQYDTAVAVRGVNGIDGNGGSMGAAGPVVSGKRLLVPSGYIGVKNGMPGNALYMFAP